MNSPLVHEMREARRAKMLAVAGVEDLRVFDDREKQLEELVARLSGLLGDHIQMKMLGQTVTLKSVSAGRHNYLWITVTQGEERYVCMIWPRPLFSDGVKHYATSAAFIDRVRMTMMMVAEEQLDFT